MPQSPQIRQALLLLIVVALGGVAFWHLREFLPAVLGAYILFVLLKKPMARLCERFGWRRRVAASALVVAALLAVLLPAVGVARLLNERLTAALKDPQAALDSVQAAVAGLETRLGFQLNTPERLQTLSEWGLREASGLLNATLFGLALVLVAFFLLWFMLVEKGGGRWAFDWLPLDEGDVGPVQEQVEGLVWSNAVGIPLMGLVQGAAALLGYSLAGVGDAWFWALLTGLAGMVPIFGVMLAYVPLAAVLFSKGMGGQAAFVLGYGFVVIGSIDNLARMWILKKIGQAHPLVTLFGVILGLKLFGFVGFVFGPILIELLLLFSKIYSKQYR